MSVRRRALEALIDITEEGAYANLRLKRAQQGLSPKDAAWVAAAVYVTLDNLIYIDQMLAKHIKGNVKKHVRAILRLGLCQMLYMNVPDRTACDESVKLAKEIGKGALSGFINGVMRNLVRARNENIALLEDPADRVSVQYSYPKWLVKELADKYGLDQTEAMLGAKPVRYSMTIRAQAPFTSLMLEKELIERRMEYVRGELDPNAFKLKKGFDIARDPLFLNGSITAQSESAMLACRVLGAKPGFMILDACAAPGGKTAYLAELMGNEGKICSWELHPHRKALMDRTLSRLRVKIAQTQTRDASIAHKGFDKMFDAVLVDAPCSGLGLFGKPDVRYAKTPEIIDELTKIQRSILNACSEYVKPGGTLLYATCTVSHRENEMIAEEFLKAHNDFEPYLPETLVPEALRPRCVNGMLQLLPHIDGTEGFFIARMTRNGRDS
ncbi:MAG: Ribosomal RNA small subunit methyltransferase B [Firmicutes bacterium ADurb.Bin182]|nr:MAG: Ribosomal RNA small subunit methyltransferase B [Firmicutes bacterium ADurb.Bin182]